MSSRISVCGAGSVGALGALLLSAVLAGCGNLSQVSPEGTTEQAVFPEPGPSADTRGTWPNMDNLRIVRAGMSKSQINDLLGPPHFNEGILGVREWDYLFHMQADGGAMQCQYKILYDKDALARTFLWKPQECADLLNNSPRP
ncbi:outer membrane protein assembly factor BamE [Pigmentiphaga sp. H8]|uniref:outer membrane protein assembly factor BamE n=1 Tax=unclassified Pigmentiphaga TaxID=2626614 RepID=UPI000F5901BD|nr:outer membrane protein assembly factor BamE [Pigmentiphaga sp. H8]AZG08338.1 outer membrane protein assembly factor BamE [Pigmentiphaga sp. H8]